MLHVEKVSAKVDAVTPRGEKAGPNKVVPAMTVTLTFKASNTVLDSIDTSLRKLVYQRADKHTKKAKEQQEELLPENADDLTARRFPKIPAFTWADKLLGYTMTLGSGLTATEPVIESGVNLSDFSITPLDGGTVEIKLKAAFRPTVENAGKHCFLIQSMVELSLEPPKPAAKQTDIEDAKATA